MIGEFYAYILHKMYIMAKKVLAYDLISGQIRKCKVVREELFLNVDWKCNSSM